jgi:hypothetical protein
MMDKPMKVRIRMQGNDEVKADYPDDLDDIGEITALRRYNRDNRRGPGRVLGLVSLVLLGIAAVLFFTLRGRESNTEPMVSTESASEELAAVRVEDEPPEKPAAPQGLSLQVRPAEGDPIEVAAAQPAEANDKVSTTESPAIIPPAIIPDVQGANKSALEDSGDSLPDVQVSQVLPQDAESATEETLSPKPASQAELGETPAETASEPLAGSLEAVNDDHDGVSAAMAESEMGARADGSADAQALVTGQDSAQGVTEVASLEADVEAAPVESGPDSLAPLVARALFTTAVEAKEPLDQVESIIRAQGEPLTRLYYFTELKNMQDERVTHRWEYQGEAVAEISFEVRGARWRVFSSKNLVPSMEGEWHVVVTDSQGQELVRDRIYYEGS